MKKHSHSIFKLKSDTWLALSQPAAVEIYAPEGTGYFKAKKENNRRITALEDVSKLIVLSKINSGNFDRESLYDDYGLLAQELKSCRYNSECKNGACAQHIDTYHCQMMAQYISLLLPGKPKDYQVITLCFSQEVYSDRWLQDSNYKVSACIGEREQLLRNVLIHNKLPMPFGGVWSMEYHTFKQPLDNYWQLKLRVISSKDKLILPKLREYMRRTKNDVIRECFSCQAVEKKTFSDFMSLVTYALDPTWREVPCSINEDLKIIKGIPRQLSVHSLPNALLAQEYLGPNVITFSGDISGLLTSKGQA